MGFLPFSLGLFRVLSIPASKLLLRLGALFIGLGFLVGALRFLPWVLGAGLPFELLLLLAAELLSMSLEVALFVAPPLAFALSSAALVERGELRALQALGAHPARIAWSGWPVLLGAALMMSAASGAWGKVAVSPSLRAQVWIEQARDACVRKALEQRSGAPAIVSIRAIDFAWICFSGEPPRLVGTLPAGRESGALSALSAHSLVFSDDMRSLHFSDARLLLGDAAEAPQRLSLSAGEIRISGVVPAGRPSNLSPLIRALLLSLSASALSLWVSLLVLLNAHKNRAHALLLGVSGASAALLVFSSLERSPTSLAFYALVPALGLFLAWFSSRAPSRIAGLWRRARGSAFK